MTLCHTFLDFFQFAGTVCRQTIEICRHRTGNDEAPSFLWHVVQKPAHLPRSEAEDQISRANAYSKLASSEPDCKDKELS